MTRTTFADPGDEEGLNVFPPTSYGAYPISSIHRRNGYRPQLVWGLDKPKDQPKDQLTFTKNEDLSGRPPKKRKQAGQSQNWNAYKQDNSAY